MSDYPKIIVAVWKNDLRLLRKLAKDPDIVDKDGRTALLAAAIDSKMDAAKVLLEAGANVNFQDSSGWSALHFASQAGSSELASLLIEKGASVNLTDSHGNTALFRATFGSRGDGSLIKVLRDAGANPNLKNDAGVSPVELARTIGNYDVAQFYVDISE